MADKIAEKADALVALYRNANSAYERSQVISHHVKSLKPSQVRGVVNHFYGDKVPTDHRDLNFLYKLANYAVIQESGVLTKEQLEVSVRHQQELIAKGPSANPEDDDQQLDEGDGMETQTERSKSKGKEKKAKSSTEKALEGKGRRKAAADWYDKDTRFILTDKGEYKPNTNSRPALVISYLNKPITMQRLIDKFVAGMKESDIGKGVKNVESLGERWVPSFVKFLIEKKSAKIAKEGDEEVVSAKSKDSKAEGKEKSSKKKKSASKEATASK